MLRVHVPSFPVDRRKGRGPNRYAERESGWLVRWMLQAMSFLNLRTFRPLVSICLPPLSPARLVICDVSADRVAGRLNRQVLFDPVDRLSLDRTRCRLVVHEHEIIRLAEKVIDRAARPDQSGDAGKEFVLEGGSRYRVFPVRMISGENSYWPSMARAFGSTILCSAPNG
jgi:hypothetical protein